MKTSDGFVFDEKVLKNLGARTLKTIRTRGLQMEAEIASRLDELEFLEVQGFSSDGFARARVNGNHQVLELDLDASYTEWSEDKAATCALLLEAINDAIYKVDLVIETEISEIKEKYLGRQSEI
ncbi:MAG: YbaB/EbfC family nucleoid-associated protein [Tatlockia sp.]|nr:YbaB/EbfC family nucleoid-associated protein [Tatlockia sp.]